MEIKRINVNESLKLSKLLEKQISMSYAGIQKLIRNKDIKINGKRVAKDELLVSGDLVEIYIKRENFKIIYEDEDIVVVFKPRRIETVNESDENLQALLQEQLGCVVYAVHRLDRNTEGLVVFAKNLNSKQSLDKVIKNRNLEKFYLAKVIGVPEQAEAKLVAYLKKDMERSRVFVSDTIRLGYEEIRTNYKLLSAGDGFSVLEVELITGKTHQIRAHLSHIGLPILGDDKYGNFEINKQEGKKFQCLVAYKLIFHFSDDDYLSRLDGFVIELDKKEIKF